VLLQHRRAGLLGLQEQGVVGVPTDQQDHPGPRSDAADPDHLAGDVDPPVLVEQHLAVGVEGLGVGAQ
jgi:hypothetical protein